jgi:DNA-binding MarR family transcriptional regulator
MSTEPHLGDLLQQVARARRTRLATYLAPHGLHPGQEGVLLLLWSHPGLRQADLARRLGVEAPTVTRMLQRLERAGLVERRADAHDGRLVRVHPTPRARLLEGVVRRAVAEVDGVLTAELGIAETSTLVGLLERAARVLTPAGDHSGA